LDDGHGGIALDSAGVSVEETRGQIWMWWREASAGTWDSMRPVKAEFETPRMVNLPCGHRRKNAIIRGCSRTEEEIRDLRKRTKVRELATLGQKRIWEEIYPVQWFVACIPELHE
jgi:hypothetical protein